MRVDQMGKAIAAILDEYQDVTVEKMKSAIDKVSKDAVRELKSTSPKRTGAYASDWAAKNIPQTKAVAYQKTVYNKKHYHLTHLLEKGHRKVNGGMVAARPHIAKVEQEAIEELVKEIKNDP